MRTPYQKLEDLQLALMHGREWSMLDLSDVDDILDIVKRAGEAVSLCSCPVPQAGNCAACRLREALRHAGAPRA